MNLAMIKYTPASELKLSQFETPFKQSLSPENRWVKMAELVPWDEMAEVFFDSLSKDQGRPTVDLRIILGAMMVKYVENLSDEDTIQYIQENIYAQYFVGLRGFKADPVFVPSLFVAIRKRLGRKGSERLNELLIRHAHELKLVKHRRNASDGIAVVAGEEGSQSKRNRGTLIVDATVAPANIEYPTDTALVHKARKISESLIDSLYESAQELWPVKPRTYRREAEKSYVGFSKKRKKAEKEIRKVLGQQIRYLRRNLTTIDKMLDKVEAAERVISWTVQQWRHYWVIQELFRQQDEMYRDKRKRTSDRIVSLDQPWVRPIKRGKGGGKDTEFGMKINASVSEGMTRMDFGSFDAFHEGLGLKEQLEGYKRVYGYYPALVLADKVYWTRENRIWLKERNIAHGGVPMGKRPNRSKYEKYKERAKNNKRSEIEGKFGTAKTKYGMERMRSRLPQTTFASINMIFLSMNLLSIAGKVPGNILFAVFATLTGAVHNIRHNFSKLFDKYSNNWHRQQDKLLNFQAWRLSF